jgi:hypothetical protein
MKIFKTTNYIKISTKQYWEIEALCDKARWIYEAGAMPDEAINQVIDENGIRNTKSSKFLLRLLNRFKKYLTIRTIGNPYQRNNKYQVIRIYACPTCKKPNMLTHWESFKGKQCHECDNRDINEFRQPQLIEK